MLTWRLCHSLQLTKHYYHFPHEETASTCLQTISHWARKLNPSNYKTCQKRVGSHDCGLFAIANTTALANGVDPATLKFQQAKMRKNLQLWLENQKLTMFPHTESDPTSHTKRTRKDTVSLHCLCHRYHPGSKTFKCSSCNNIFRLMCIYPRLNCGKRLNEISSKLQCSTCVLQQS